MPFDPPPVDAAIQMLIAAGLLTDAEFKADPYGAIGRVPHGKDAIEVALGGQVWNIDEVTRAANVVRREGAEYLRSLGVEPAPSAAERLMGASPLREIPSSIRWDDPEIVALLLAFPPSLQIPALEMIADQLMTAHKLFLRKLGEEVEMGLVPAELLPLLARAQAAHERLMGLVEPFGFPSPGDSKEAAARTLAASLSDLREIYSLMEAVSSRISPLPLVAHPTQRLIVRPVSDLGGEPHRLLIDMSLQRGWQDWAPRLSLIQAFLARFPRAQVTISLRDQDLPEMSRLLSGNERFDLGRIGLSIHSSVYRRAGEYRHDWLRNGILLVEGEKGRQLWVAPALLEQGPAGFRAMALEAGAISDVHPLPRFDGGQFLFGEWRAWAGIMEVLRIRGRPFFFSSSLDESVKAIATIMGRETHFVGDPVWGQALHHIDLYFKPLSDESVLVADFRAGWEEIRSLSPAEIDQLEAEYRRRLTTLDRLYFVGGRRPEEQDLYLALLNAVRNEASPMRKLIDRWVLALQAGIDAEARELENWGMRVTRVLALPFPSVGGGVTYLNSIIHQGERGPVVFLPPLGERFDRQVIEAYHRGGFDGEFEFVDGMELLQLELGGGPHCVSYVTPPPGDGEFPEADYLISATQLEGLLTRVRENRDYLRVVGHEAGIAGSMPPFLREIEPLIDSILREQEIDPRYDSQVTATAVKLHELGRQAFSTPVLGEVISSPYYWFALIRQAADIVFRYVPWAHGDPAVMMAYAYFHYSYQEYVARQRDPAYWRRQRPAGRGPRGTASVSLNHPHSHARHFARHLPPKPVDFLWGVGMGEILPALEGVEFFIH